MTGLRDRQYDLALVRRHEGSRDLADEDLNVLTLFDDELVVAAGINTQWATHPDVRIADLLGEPWILSPPGYWHHTRVEEAFRSLGLSLPKPRVVSFNVSLRMQLMSAGPYVSVFTSSVMRQNAHRFGIAALPIALPSKPFPVVIVTLRNRTQSAVVERFIESAREVAQTLPRAGLGAIR
jgi:DNA-binding transcriptional LysR family regulator